MSKVAFVGRNVALQSLAMASSDLPSLAYGATTNVPLVSVSGKTAMSPYVEEYNRLKAELKSNHKTFAERQRAICMELLNRVEMSASPDSPEFGLSAVAAHDTTSIAAAVPSAAAPAPSLDYASIVETLSKEDITKMPPAAAKVILEYIQGMIKRGEINISTIAPEERVMYEQLVKRAAKASAPAREQRQTIVPERASVLAGRGGGRRTRKLRGAARHATRKQRGYKRGSSRRQRN